MNEYTADMYDRLSEAERLLREVLAWVPLPRGEVPRSIQEARAFLEEPAP